MPALNAFAALVAALIWAAPAFGQIARILDAKGTSIVQRAGQPSRILGQGEQLDEKDVISVARDSYAILEFRDQTRITLRPNTVFRLDSYRDSASESMLFGLIRGGFRAVTGLVGKANPKAVKFTTATATMGIRGTEFDARLCEDDCAAEERARPAPPTRHGPVARVVEMNGIIAASRAGTGARLLVAGASIYEGDGIATGPRSYVVLAFRDGSRITVAGDSRLAILVYQFDEAKRAGHAVLNHVAGGARVQTGAIAKQGPEFYRFITPLGDVRPRGTGFDSFVNTVAGGVQDTRQAADDAKRQADADARKKADETKRKADEAKRLAEEAAKRAAAAASDAGKGAQSSAPKSPPPPPPMDHDAVRDVASVASASIQVIPGIGPVIGPAASAASNAAPGAAQELDQAAAEARLQADQAAAAAKQKMEQIAGDADTATRRNASRIDTAVNQMENAAPAAPSPVAMLNAAVEPLLLEMTALMTQLRNNPPTTEAAAQQAAARLTQLGNRVQAVINQAIGAAGITANSTEFRTAVGLAYAALMHFYSVVSIPSNILVPGWQALTVLVQGALVTPYLSESLALVGLSDSDLRRILPLGPTGAHTVIEDEVGSFFASQGSAAAQALFAEGQATAGAARQRAEQEAAAAKQRIDQAAAEGKLKADQTAADAKLKADQAAAAVKRQSAEVTAARRSTDQDIAEAQKRAQQILAEIKVQMDSAPKPGEVATMADELAWASTLITVAFVRNMGDQIFAGGRDEQAGGGGVPTPSIPVVTVSALMLEIIAEGVADHLTRWAPVGVETAGNTSVPVATLSAMILTMIANRLVDGVESAGNASVPVATLSAMILTMIANRLVDQTEDRVSADARALVENRIRAIQALAEETIGARAGRTEAGQQEAGQSKPGGRRQVLHTWDGVVEVGDPVNGVAVRKDQTISIAGLGSNPVFLREPPSDMIDSKAPRPDRVKVDPSLFGTDPKGIDAGLYVWVREGAISLDREGKTVDVPAGSAAVATSGRVGLLDTVPNFLRFDGTPRPVRAPGGAVVDAFRAPDGSVLGMCAVR